MLWHSAAHLLGNALELLYPDTLLCDGPALSSSSRGAVTEGFYYELHTAQTLSSRDFDALTASLLNLAKQKRKCGWMGPRSVLATALTLCCVFLFQGQCGPPLFSLVCSPHFCTFNPKFERMQLPVSVARTMFEYNPFKMALLDDIAARNEPVTVYRCGDFIDLCRGPHVPNTGRIKWAQLTRTSSSHRSADGPLLQRVYGVAFGSADHGREWQERVAEAERRDHRAIAVRQGLAMWNELSAGSAFFLPDGTFIYNRLLEMLRVEYGRRGFQEVITPQLFDRKLWEQSGHWEHYRNDMFLIACNHHSHGDTAEASEPTMGLKPMNCPAHCLIFAHQPRSHHDLPLRLADFGALHRNEHSGALTGLTRVRKFQQDDAHIFCSEDQLGGELRDCLTFLRDVYARLGFVEWSLRLSTRPADYVGELALWDKAEATLRATLEQSGMEWALNPGDGAFYGPKVDVCVRDAMGRLHQCGTIQLDFQLPRRFGLHFTDAQQNRRVPVMIHRAILGSVERMFAVLAEHCGGRWPVWLNPRMVAVVPVADAHHDYATSVVESLCRAGVRATALTGADTMAKKVLWERERERGDTRGKASERLLTTVLLL